MTSVPMAMGRRWLILIKERFPPPSYLPMVTVFVLGNAALSQLLTGVSLKPMTLFISFFVTLSFFFRLRLFDEIKDYEVDLQINPGRPLARGLLTIPEVKQMILALSLFELAMAAWLGWAASLAHATAMLYSFLMYREFFVGRWLRPRLTTYAVSHTFVSVLVGASIAAQSSGQMLWDFSRPLILILFINWLLFNLFEFARKTFAASEERAGVDSYSSLFGPLGASILSMSQIILTVWLVTRILPPSLHLALMIPPTVSAISYGLHPNISTAKIFRTVTAIYLISAYALITWQCLG